MARPLGKVLNLGGLFQPQLIWDRQRVQLGLHQSREVAVATYDVAKLLLARKLGGDDVSFEGFKLHRPAASYTSHPLWRELSGPHCSFEEVCSLLVGGAAEEFLHVPPTAVGKLRSSGLLAARRQQESRGAGSSSSMSGSDGEEGSISGTSIGGGNGSPPMVTAGRMTARWQGLFPEDTGCYSVVLSPSMASGKSSETTIPAAYVRAIAGTMELPVTLTVTTPDGMQHSWQLRWYERQRAYYISKLSATMTALGAKPGDRLCFVPTGPAAADVWLLRGPAGAALHPAAQQVQQAAAGSCGMKRRRNSSDAWHPTSSSNESSDELSSSSKGGSLANEWLSTGRLLPGGASRLQQEQGSGAGSTNKWSGLEPEDSGRYCMRVPPSLVRAPGRGAKGNTSIPRRYLRAISGCDAVPPQLLVTLPDGRQRACAVRMHGGGCFLTAGALASWLGAAPGDFLCFIPASRGAATVQLQKTLVASGGATAASCAAPGVAAAIVATDAAGTAGAAAAAPMAAMLAAAEELGADSLKPRMKRVQSDGQGRCFAELSDTSEGSEQEGLAQRSDSEYKPPRKRQRWRGQQGSHSSGSCRGHGASPNWSGLEEGDVDEDVYTLTLPAAAFKEGGSLKIHTPARYLKALFGGVPAEGRPATPIDIIAQGRHFKCGMALYSRRKGCVLLGVGVGSLLASLGAELGDKLQLRPEGTHAAHATLVKASTTATARAAAGGSQGSPGQAAQAPTLPSPWQQQQQQLQLDDVAAEEGATDEDEVEVEAHQQQQLQHQLQQGGAAGPGQRKLRGRGRFTSSWSGLEPVDIGYYTVKLSSHAVNRERRIWISGRYAAAIFGQSAHLANTGKLVVKLTAAAGSTYSLTLVGRTGNQCQLSGMRGLLTDLGAAAGDQLCFQPLSQLAARVSLIKAAALDEADFREADSEEAEGEEGEGQEEEEPQAQQHSPAAAAPSPAPAGNSALVSQAVQQQDGNTVKVEMSVLLKAAKEQGGLPAGAAAAYRAKFEALPTHDWRLVHCTSLKALVDEGNWGAVQNWIQLALLP